MDRTTAIKKISDKFSIPENKIIELLEGTPAPKKENQITPTKKKRFMPIVVPQEISHTHVPKKKYFFTKEDYNLFCEKFSTVQAEIKRLGDEVGKSCEESESWHDNFTYEEGGRQQGLWKDHLRYLRNIKEKASILTQESSADYICIGSQVEFETENGEIVKKRIGSYITFSDSDLSYESPLGKILMGKKLGDEISAIINEIIVKLTIKKIE